VRALIDRRTKIEETSDGSVLVYPQVLRSAITIEICKVNRMDEVIARGFARVTH